MKQIAMIKKKSSRDRISALDDDVLIHILSFLPTNDAVKTGVLSKRWLRLWTFVPCLKFQPFCPKSRHAVISRKRFLKFVDDTLFFHKSEKITKFSLKFGYFVDTGSRIRLASWVNWACMANVEDMVLHVDSPLDYKFPMQFYTCSTLKKLELSSYTDFHPVGLVQWNSLKELIVSGHFYEDSIDNLLSGAPVLESLKLEGSIENRRITISHPALRTLVLKFFCDTFMDNPLKIECPHLHSLSIEGCLISEIQLGNLPSLITAKLEFSEDVRYMFPYRREYKDMWMKMLEGLIHVTKLNLGSWCINCLPDLDASNLPLLKCKELTISSNIQFGDFPRIAALLHSSRELEVLTIDGVVGYPTQEHDNNVGKSYLESCKSRLVCLSSHLKVVRITVHSLDEPLILFIKFLLVEAHVLKEMIIHEKRPTLKVARELAKLRRSSSHAVILFT